MKRKTTRMTCVDLGDLFGQGVTNVISKSSKEYSLVFCFLFFVYDSGFPLFFFCVCVQVLHLSQGDLAIMTSGHVINLISNDVQRFNDAVRYFPNVCMAPFAVLAACSISYSLIGWQVLPGFALLTLMLIFQEKASEIISNLRKKAAELADRRLKLLNEIIRGIRAVKMYAWEKHFRNKIRGIRR